MLTYSSSLQNNWLLSNILSTISTHFFLMTSVTKINIGCSNRIPSLVFFTHCPDGSNNQPVLHQCVPAVVLQHLHQKQITFEYLYSEQTVGVYLKSFWFYLCEIIACVYLCNIYINSSDLFSSDDRFRNRRSLWLCYLVWFIWRMKEVYLELSTLVIDGAPISYLYSWFVCRLHSIMQSKRYGKRRSKYFQQEKVWENGVLVF